MTTLEKRAWCGGGIRDLRAAPQNEGNSVCNPRERPSAREQRSPDWIRCPAASADPQRERKIKSGLPALKVTLVA